MENENQNKISCNKCNSNTNQIKKGKTPCGSQRFYCKICDNKYTPIKKGWNLETKQMAVKTYLEGKSARKVGKLFGMDGNTIKAWVALSESESSVKYINCTSKINK